jgi:predicted transglutaminase-like cysteine proteinase
MNKKLNSAKYFTPAIAFIVVSMFTNSASATVYDNDGGTGAIPSANEIAFVGGLPAGNFHFGNGPDIAAPYEVAAYDHLLVVEDPPAGLDPIETGAIVAGVFESVAIPIHKFPVSSRWGRIMTDITSCAAANACEKKNKLLATLDEQTAGKSFVEKIRVVNSVVNNTLRYRADQSVYGKLDYWATPTEILSRASGDCEDFAILKMTALMRAGIPANSLSLVVLRDNGRGVFHAVLAVTTSSGSFILDNARVKVAMDSDLPNYQPLYSLSNRRAWIHGTKKTVSQPAVAQTSDLSSVAPGEGFAMDPADLANEAELALRPSLN